MMAETVEQLPIAKLKAAPDNIRADVGDVAELAESIKELGVIEPIIAVKRGDGFLVVAGARRLAGAALAGEQTVPVIVREMDEQQRVLAMTIENLQREDLTPLEEAGAYQRLLDELQISQHELAPRVGKHQSHISKRVALLALPEDVQAKVDAGGIDLAAAGVLAKLATVAGPKAVSTLVKGRPAVSTDFGFIAKRELDRIDAEAAFRKVKDELKASQIKMLSPVKDRYGNFDLPKGAVEISKSGGYYSLKLDPEKHKDEPCHAAVVFDSSCTVKFVCTNRKRHPKLKTQDETYRVSRGSNRRGPDVVKQVKEAAVQRRAFVAELLARKTAFPKADTVRLIVDAFLERASSDATRRAAVMLGLEPIESKRYGSVVKDYEQPLRTLAAKGEAELLRVGLAIAFGHVEGELDSQWNTNWNDHHAYLHLLEQQGHKLTTIEKKRMGAAAPRRRAA